MRLSDKPFREDYGPTADDAAAAVIAGCLTSMEAAEQAVEILTPDDFRDASPNDVWPDVFAAIKSLVDKGNRPAPVMVDREAKRLGLAEGRNLTEVLSYAMRMHTPGTRMAEYVEIIREMGYRRRLRNAGLEQVALADRMDLNAQQLEAEVEAIKAKVASVSPTDKLRRLGDIIEERVELHRNRKRGSINGLATGFHEVDDILLGLQGGDLIILAARPAMGKTALAEGLAVNVAKAQHREENRRNSVGIISIEMPDVQLADRAIASEGVVDGSLIRSAMVEPKHWESIRENLGRSGVRDANVFVDDVSRTVPQIRRWALRVKREHGLDLLIIDYLQIVQVGDRYRGNRVNEVGEISASLKALAKELKIPIIALSQLSRAVEQRDDKRPMLSDLRDTGNIEQDADIVAFLYRDEYYADLEKRESTAPGEAELIIAKHRNGPTGTARLGFIKQRTKFTNQDRKHG